MNRFYCLTSSLLLLPGLSAHAQVPAGSGWIRNLQAVNITATSATITFDGGGPGGLLGGCGYPTVSYALAGGAWVGIPYAKPTQLTGLPPATPVTVQFVRRDVGMFSTRPCDRVQTVAVTFQTAAAPLAVAPAAEGSRLALVPNPARTSAVLTLAAPLPAPAVVRVLDAVGREVGRQALPARATTAALDLAGLAPGLYLVRAGEATARLVVE